MKLFSLISSLLVLVSCTLQSSPRAESKPVSNDPVAVQNAFECKSIHENDEFDCLRRACQFAGGEFREKLHQCQCPSDKIFVGGKNPNCANLDARLKCARDENSGEYNCDVGESSQLTSILLHSQKDISEQKLPAELAQLTAGLSMDSAALAFADPLLQIFIDDEPNQPKALLKLIASHSPYSYNSLRTAYYLPVDEPLSSLTSEALPEIQKNILNLFSTKLKLDAATSATVTSAIDQVLLNKLVPTYEPSTYIDKLACLRDCHLRQLFKFNPFLITRDIDFLNGKRFRDLLTVTYLESGDVIASIGLTPSGKVNSFAVFSKTIEQDGYKLKGAVYTYWGALVNESTRQVNLSAMEKLKDILAVDDIKNRPPAVVVCEMWNPFNLSLQSFSKSILFGPNSRSAETLLQSRNISGSYWGWGALRSLSEIDLARRYFETSDLWIRYPIRSQNSDNNSHEVLISRLITEPFELEGEEKRTPLIPLSGPRCLVEDEMTSLITQIPNSTRIVNVSLTTDMDFEQCTKRTASSIAKTKDRLLWVVSAGNEGKLVENPTQLESCPQSLSGQSNILIVAASNGDRLWQGQGGGANYGEQYADLAVEANSTSEAAAKVSRFANIINAKYPNLTIQQLKWILILGAETHGLPLRSHGLLNQDDTMRMAEEIYQGHDFAEAIDEVFRGFFNRRLREEKKRILQELQTNEVRK